MRDSSHHQRPAHRQGPGATRPVTALHHELVSDYRALQAPQTLFVVEVLGRGTCVLQVHVRDMKPSNWRGIARLSQHRAERIGLIQQRYVFAYSPTARTATERVRQHLHDEGWSIVHADTTGCRTLSNASSDRRILEPAYQGYLASPVRDQRYALLENARAVLGKSAQLQLSPEDLAVVADALSDEAVQVRCLPWQDRAAAHLWQQATGSSDPGMKIVAGALLASARCQQGDLPAAREALSAAIIEANRHGRTPRSLTLATRITAQKLGPAAVAHLAETALAGGEPDQG